LEIASSIFEFVVEHRVDCTTRIYQASPHDHYGVRTWLKKADDPITMLDLFPNSHAVTAAAEGLDRREKYRSVTAKAKIDRATLDPSFVHNFTQARSDWGSGKPLSDVEFAKYILQIKDLYTIYCDELHHPHRTAWQTLRSYLTCSNGARRQKPKAANLFVKAFGESLDECSPNTCSFAFDTYAYDERSCDSDVVRDMQRRLTVRTPAWEQLQWEDGPPLDDAHVKLPVNWDELEQTPAAEDDDFDERHTVGQAQEASVMSDFNQFIYNTIYDASKAMSDMASYLAGETPRERDPVRLDLGDRNGSLHPITGAPLPKEYHIDNISQVTTAGEDMAEKEMGKANHSATNLIFEPKKSWKKRATSAERIDQKNKTNIVSSLFDLVDA